LEVRWEDKLEDKLEALWEDKLEALWEAQWEALWEALWVHLEAAHHQWPRPPLLRPPPPAPRGGLGRTCGP